MPGTGPRCGRRLRSLARISHKLSTALRYVGAGGDFPGFGTLQGVDPASPPNLHETPASTRPPFARHEFCEICGLGPSFAEVGKATPCQKVRKMKKVGQ